MGRIFFAISLSMFLASPQAIAADGRWIFEKEWQLGERKVEAAKIAYASGLQLGVFCEDGTRKPAFSTRVAAVSDQLMTILKSSISEFGIDGEVLAKFPTVDSFSKDRAVFVVPGEQTEGDFAKVIEGFGAAQKNISVALTLNNRSQKFNFSAKGSTKAVSTLNQRCSK